MNEYLNRAGHPAQTVNRGPADGVAPQPAVNGSSKKPKKDLNFGKILFVVFSVLIAILLIGVIVSIFTSKDSTTSQIKKDQYQAVFLNSSDGQVYFGKLSVLNSRYYKLTDIYYVRVQQVQPDKNNSATTSNISLAKLGNEIHGPEDVMFINRDSVMFWENLKEGGQVVKAIREYQKNPTPSTTPAPTVSPTPTK